MSSYELEASLGSGPGSTTWRAVSTAGGSFGQQVVLATVASHTIDGKPVALDNLLGISQIWHPNLAKVFNVGRNGGQVFVATEFVDGTTLDTVGQHAPRWQVLRMLGIACKALAYLHERGLYHGGVSSKRVMLSETGWIKLRGLGLVKVAEATRVAEGRPDQCMEQDRRSVVEMIDELGLADDPRAALALRGLRQRRPQMDEVGEALLSAAAIIGAPAVDWRQGAGSRNAA